MPVVIEDFRAAAAAYARYWRLTDEILYELCRNHYLHTTRAAINAKLLIIGRSYATGVERAIKTNQKQGGSLSRLADWMQKHADVIDGVFDALRSLGTQVTVENLRRVVGLHGEFLTILKPVTQRKQSLRSFASKYMHFHCPIVPIYDNIAAAWFPSFVRMQSGLRVFTLPKGADRSYGEYVLRTLNLFQTIVEREPSATIREIDQYVLYDPSAPLAEVNTAAGTA